MTDKKLAQHYLRYWHEAASGEHWLSDNAPANYRSFVSGRSNREMAHAAMLAIATGKIPVVPDSISLMRWCGITPSASDAADKLLGGKHPPKTLVSLMRDTYLSMIRAERASVQAWLQEQIDQF